MAASHFLNCLKLAVRKLPLKYPWYITLCEPLASVLRYSWVFRTRLYKCQAFDYSWTLSFLQNAVLNFPSRLGLNSLETNTTFPFHTLDSGLPAFPGPRSLVPAFPQRQSRGPGTAVPAIVFEAKRGPGTRDPGPWHS